MKKFIVPILVLFVLFAFTVARAEELPDFLSNLPVTAGKYFFVCSVGGSDDYPTDESTHSWQFPVNTIDAAINACTNADETAATEYGRDVIVILPNHTEDIDAATDLVADTEGIYFYGCGEGDTRPLLAFTGTSGTILISDESTTWENIVFENQLDDIAECIDVGADDTTFINCEFRDKAGTSGKIFIMVDGANTADRLTIDGCLFTHINGTENGDCSIEIDDAQDRLVIKNSSFYGDCDEAPIISDAVNTNCFLYNLYVENTVAGGYAIELTAASTGFMDKVLVYTDDAATAIDPGSLKIGPDVKISMGVDLPSIPFPTSGTRINAGIIDVYVQSGTDTTIVDEALCGYPNDYFNYGWTVKFADADGTGINVDVTDFVAATGSLTVDSMSETPAAGDRVILSFNPLMSDVVSATDLTNEVPDGSVLSYILDDAGDSSSYDDSKHSLYAIGTDTDSIITTLASVAGLPYFAVTADSGDTTSIVDATYGTYSVDYFNVGWVATCIYNANSVGNDPEGETRDISDFATSTGDFTVGAAFGAAVEANDVFLVYYDPLKAQAASKDLTDYYPDNSAMSYILDDGGDTSGFDGVKHSLKSIGDDTDTLITYTDHIADAALPTAPTANSIAAFIASGGTGLGTELADSHSIVDAIGSTGAALLDDAAGVAGQIGVNDNNNAMDTSSVASNQDGSVFERLEQLMRMQPQVSEISNVAMGASQADMWTIASGYIEVMGLYAFVTTAADATNTNMKLTYDPSQGTDTDICANLDIVSDAQYSYWYITGDVSDAAINAVMGTDVAHMFFEEGGLILGPGTIDLTLDADPSATAAWYLVYRTLEPGATVTPFAGD